MALGKASGLFAAETTEPLTVKIAAAEVQIEPYTLWADVRGDVMRRVADDVYQALRESPEYDELLKTYGRRVRVALKEMMESDFDWRGK
jgi:hypothetical protein